MGAYQQGGGGSEMAPPKKPRKRVSVCTKGSNFLCAEVNHHPEVNLHYGDFVWANSNMADRTGGQLESTVRVSNVGAKGFEPSTG